MATEAPATPAAATPTPAKVRRAARLSRGDRWAVGFLVGIPAVVFIGPALFGHPAIAGDNLLQSFPLRVLSGDLVGQGHLPLWNPFIWSGNPLLGGLNAGALYPLTLLFAFLPPISAWVLNLLVIYWVAALGTYALLRQYRLSPLASGLGSATCTFAGAMVAQMVHFPIVQGWALAPLLVLAELRLAGAFVGDDRAYGLAGEAPLLSPGKPLRSPWPATAAMAVCGGLILLTGEPRGMVEAEVVAVVVTVWLAVRPYGGAVDLRRRCRFVVQVAVAGAWAVALGAVQIIPGWSFISTTSRASASLGFFGSGSLLPKWTVLLAVPFIFGGDGILHMPTFFGAYNLPEVTGYVGLVPLAGTLALLTRSFGRRRDPAASAFGLWLVLLVVGLLLAWGTYTPLGGLFWHIPLLGQTRLQSRNLGLVDLALGVLVAFFLDRLFRGRTEEAGLTGWRRWLVAGPALGAVLLCVLGLAIPRRLEEGLDIFSGYAHLGRQLTPWFLLQLVVALAVAGLLLFWSRLPPVVGRRGLVAVMVVDLLLFTVTASTGFSAGRNPTFEPSRAYAVAVLGANGRFGFYDTTALNVNNLDAIGQPDLNAFTKLRSVDGYGSTVSGVYGTVTGAHTLETVDPCALRRGVFDQLRLATLLTLPGFVAPELGPHGGQVPVQHLAPPPGNPEACPGAPEPGTATLRTFFFGQPLTLTGADLLRDLPTRSTPRVGVVLADGTTRYPATVVVSHSGGWTVRFVAPQRGVGLVVRGPARAVATTSTVTAAGGTRYSLNGLLQDALGVGHWRYTGAWENFGRFQRGVRPPVWLASGAPAGSSVRQLSVEDNGTETDHLVASGPVTVVRSEAYAGGWHVSAAPAGGGPARSLPVVVHGLVQSVRVPAGTWTLTFTYWPESVTIGLVGTVVGVLGLVVVGAFAVVRRRRRSRPTAA